MKDGNNNPLDETRFSEEKAKWEAEYKNQVKTDDEKKNRSGIPVAPLYTPEDTKGMDYTTRLGFPGEGEMKRGIYASMHRGRPWTQRQLVGLGTPADANVRMKKMMAEGMTGASVVPCNVHLRGYDYDEIEPELVGVCGTALSSIDDLETNLKDIPIESVSIGNNDPSPFTLAAQLFVLAKKRGIPLDKIKGTSNQSDYISHFVANHMFYRLSLPGSRRMLTDHIAYTLEHVPGWNPVSVVGQHMQQAGATPAQAMAFTLCTAVQYAQDCIERGLDPDHFLPRFTFFFDISISFFEEVAKFRAGRAIWARLTRERLGAKDKRSMRFKFHGQTSGADLTRQQPLNNIARVAVQAMAGIFAGAQSLHADSYDEALGTPKEEAAKIAIASLNILREEAHLGDVIDPLGGGYYMESLTMQMEDEILKVIAQVDAAGGMYQAVEKGLVQGMIGESALASQMKLERGEEKQIGVNAFVSEDDKNGSDPQPRPAPEVVETQVQRLKKFKAERNQGQVTRALGALASMANDPNKNVFAAVVEATEANATHGEIVATLRKELGFGQPRIAV